MKSRRLIGILMVTLLLLALDVGTKWAVQEYLPHMRDSAPVYPYGGIALVPNFLGVELSITHATNTGAVWGVLAGYQYALLAIRLVLVAGLIGYLVLGKQKKGMLAPLLLIIAGAIGNVIDIFAYGHVIDMIGFRFWGWQYPIFNLADAFISIGIGWLMLHSLLEKRKRHASDHG